MGAGAVGAATGSGRRWSEWIALRGPLPGFSHSFAGNFFQVAETGVVDVSIVNQLLSKRQ